MKDWSETRAAIAALGYDLGPDVLQATRALFVEEHQAFADVAPPPVGDLSYGEHPRQCLDVYEPQSAQEPAPVMVWVHGGGFLKGAKSDPGHPFEAHVGRFAARNGFLGVVIGYRLAPDDVWPSGPEDLSLVVDWLNSNASDYGGDPERIVLTGTSAGAAHIAGYLQRRVGNEGIRGVALLSGLYGFTQLEDRDRLYYAKDPGQDNAQLPRQTMIETGVPLFAACAEFDLPRFQAETLGLIQARLQHHGHMPRSTIAVGHNHYSIGCHLGCSDSRLSGEIVAFA